MLTEMLWYAAMARNGFRFVHVTDTHIMAGGAWRLRGTDIDFDTDASLRRVVDVIRALDPAPAFAILGGDLASPDILHRDRTLTAAEYEPSYARLREILAGLPCPVHPLMGNHDQREAFNRVLRAAAPDALCYYAFEHAGVHFVALDSHQPGRASGALDAAQLSWLERDLVEHRERLTIVFVHHHPWPLGLQWIDTMPLENGEALMTLLARHPQARWVIGGHVHLDQVIERGGLTFLTTPSTCVQLSKTLPGPAYGAEAPGFRVVDVADGRLSTRVIRVPGPGDFAP
jgi:3',5'-cyclic-AMP phosphodiesterase